MTKKKSKFQSLEQPQKLAAGRYLLTDPCYVIPKEMWDEFCHVLHSSYGDEHWFTFKGISFFVYSTHDGDGCYPVFEGIKNKYYYSDNIGKLGVDAGLLSIVPEELTKKWKWTAACKRNKRLIEITKWVELDKECEIEAQNGDFSFDNFHVNTSWDGIVDEEEELQEYRNRR